MEKTQKREAENSTYKDAQLFKDLFDALKGVYGNDAPDYFRQYLKLWPQYRRLKSSGVNVRFSPPRFGRRPLLIIDRKVSYSYSKKSPTRPNLGVLTCFKRQIKRRSTRENSLMTKP